MKMYDAEIDILHSWLFGYRIRKNVIVQSNRVVSRVVETKIKNEQPIQLC